LALVGGTVYRSPAVEPTPNSTVLLREGHVVAIGAADSIAVPPDACVIDCRGRTVMAGFQNSHVHLLGPEWAHPDTTPDDTLSARFQALHTQYGFTTILDLGSVLANTLALRRRIESGEVRGPRILTSGQILFPRDGIPYYAAHSLLRAEFPQPDGPDSAARAAARLLDEGADFLKLYLVTYPTRWRILAMPRDVAIAAAEEAHRRGKLVFAHPSTAEGLDLALAAKVDVLAHAIEMAPGWNDETARRVAHAGVTMIPTLALFHRDPLLALVSRVIGRTDHFRQVASFARAGGRVVMGTDAGYLPDHDPTLEYVFMARAGLGHREILAALTTAPAALLGESAERGTLDPGKRADVTVLWNDPAADVREFANVRSTIRDGHVLHFAESPRPLRAEPAVAWHLLLGIPLLVLAGVIWAWRRRARRGSRRARRSSGRENHVLPGS